MKKSIYGAMTALVTPFKNGKIDENDILNRYNIMEYEIKEDFSNEIIETLELDDDINTEINTSNVTIEDCTWNLE